MELREISGKDATFISVGIQEMHVIYTLKPLPLEIADIVAGLATGRILVPDVLRLRSSLEAVRTATSNVANTIFPSRSVISSAPILEWLTPQISSGMPLRKISVDWRIRVSKIVEPFDKNFLRMVVPFIRLTEAWNESSWKHINDSIKLLFILLWLWNTWKCSMESFQNELFQYKWRYYTVLNTRSMKYEELLEVHIKIISRRKYVR